MPCWPGSPRGRPPGRRWYGADRQGLAGSARTLGGVSINVPPDEQAATFTSTVRPGGLEGELLKREAVALKRAEGLRARGHRLLDLEKLERVGVYLVHTEDGSVWTYEEGEPREGRDPKQDAFGLTDSFGLRWYRRAPVTVDELLAREQRSEELMRKAEAEGAAEQRKRRKSPTERVLTFADLHPRVGPGPLTLREAITRLEAQGAVVTVEAGSVYVHATPSDSINELAALVHAAEAIVLDAVDGRSGAVDPARVPDLELTPSGKPLGEKMDGRESWL
jgi:hypothetical protein